MHEKIYKNNKEGEKSGGALQRRVGWITRTNLMPQLNLLKGENNWTHLSSAEREKGEFELVINSNLTFPDDVK